MAKFIKGDVVVVPFPFSNLTQAKRRPALVIAELLGDDVILCQITSQSIQDIYSIPIDDTDCATGGLKQPSNIRPNRIFIVDNHIILYRVGSLKKEKLSEVISKVTGIIQANNG
ncbi:MAG: type II toxin-antitoxin system PemK/MazF family toxin [bacterium]|nr:type II toxin-antitoxin system PemK/MazF family toxin [bacterium]